MLSETPDILPFTSPIKTEILTEAELSELKRGTLHLLEDVGIHFPSKIALGIFADHDICQHVYEMMNSKRSNELEAALDLIQTVGPGSHFLAQEHTRQHIRRFRLSTLLGQKDPDRKPRDPRELALEEFKHIDATHHPHPLPKEVLIELDRILATAEREAEQVEIAQ